MSVVQTGRRFDQWTAVAGGAIGAGIGLAIGAEAPWAFAGLALAFAILLGAIVERIASRTFKPAYVEIPAILLLIANLSLRAREATELADNPLDAAGLVKLGATLLALGIGALAIVTPMPGGGVPTTTPFKLYVAYGAVAFAGIAFSEMPPLTGYRVIEVIAAIVVVFGAVRAASAEALPRLLSVLRGWAYLMVAAAWLAVALAPSIALEPVESPIPYRIDIPTLGITANSLGTFGALVAAWSLAALFDPVAAGRTQARARHVSGFVVGVITVVGAQYRTGYVALAVVVGVLLVLRARVAMMFGVLAALMVLSFWGPAVSEVEPLLLRGETRAEAAELSNRIEWWTLAGPIWEQSPVVGKGLRTASRFLLADVGYGDVGTLHSTWVEALVGTGLLGVLMLLLSLVTGLWLALRVALSPGGSIAFLLTLLVLAVRSITGTTFEAGGFQVLLFLSVVMSLGTSGWRAAIGRMPSWRPPSLEERPAH